MRLQIGRTVVKRVLEMALLTLALGAAGFLRGEDATTSAPIDWERARTLHQKAQQGVALTPAEQAELDRATAARQAGQGSAPAALASLPAADRARMQVILEKRQNGEPLTTEEQTFARDIRARLGGNRRPASDATPTSRAKTGLVPLTDMTAGENYHGREGGLYGAGKNEPPPEHLKAALATARQIEPLDAAGKPAAGGKIALLSVGMSNTTQEFSRFIEFAAADREKAPAVVLVDGAQGGQAAAQWVTAPDNRVWQTVDTRLKTAGVSPAQVQAVWLKQAEIRPTEPFPRDAEKLAPDITKIVQMLKTKFPNLRIAYLSSRIYAGYATTALNPEPYAYDGAFAVRDVIARQIAGDPALNFDPAKNAVTAPVLLWGPYLWADGITPRKSDGLVWRREDLREDGTHPSATSGRDKVAKLLLAFLKTHPTAKIWFVRK
jgi:hypothetical protein